MACSPFGFVQGWWSVTGLTIEILGFVILSLDVIREYNRYNTINSWRAAAAAARRHIKYKAPSELVHDDPNLKLHQEIAQLLHQLDGMTARGAWISANLVNPSDDYENAPMAKIAEGLINKIEQRQSAPLKRAPIYKGIFLVLFGASLQLVGSWPCQ